MNKLSNKQFELQQKNRQLEQRKKQIEQQLKQMDIDETEQILNYKPINEKINQENNDEQYEENVEEKEQSPKDLITQIQSVRKNQQQRNQNNLKQLKKTMDSNKQKIYKNKQKLQRLQNNIEQAESALKMKNELKKQLQSKGKKISQESKKWINDVARLNDKAEELRDLLNNQMKEEESLKSSIYSLQKKLNEINKDRTNYETQQKSSAAKLQVLKQQIETAKNLLRQKQSGAKDDSVQNLKKREKLMVQQKRLQRQKNELLKAYRKLAQYITLLRKINTHLQTANSLDFSMKQYLQAIDRSDIIL